MSEGQDLAIRQSGVAMFSRRQAEIAAAKLGERWADFRKLLAKYDPQGKFRNGFIEQYVMA